MQLQAKHLLLPIGCLLAIGLFAQGKAAGMLSYIVKSAGLSFEGVTPVLKLNVTVQNPSNQQFVIRSITGEATIDGDTVGNFYMFQTVAVYPNSEQIVPLYVRLNSTAIVSDLVRLIQLGGNSLEVRMKGFINVNGFVSDLNLNYKVL